jgi:hypothetical protein
MRAPGEYVGALRLLAHFGGAVWLAGTVCVSAARAIRAVAL